MPFVASFAEAWIEILLCEEWGFKMWVASFAEAWIEIDEELVYYLEKNSRLLRGGVDWNKGHTNIYAGKDESPPSRRRGLKFMKVCVDKRIQFVASFAEAWIEIVVANVGVVGVSRRLLRGGVDWNRINPPRLHERAKVASFAEAWIEMEIRWIMLKSMPSRLLRGGVDWNSIFLVP